jgi:hypothetical protein
MFYDPAPDPSLLWQGDIIRNFVVPAPPERVLILRDPPETVPTSIPFNNKNLQIRAIFEKDDLIDAYSLTRESLYVDSVLTNVAIVSHSCDIDRKPFLTLAVVSPITSIDNLSRRENLKTWHRVFECFWLPAANGLEDSFIDLTLLFPARRETVIAKLNDRVLSMTPEYRTKFKYKLGQYLTRPDE